MRGAEISFEDWQIWMQVGAFAFIFLTFCIFTIRTLLMKREREKQLASMPLVDDESSDRLSVSNPESGNPTPGSQTRLPDKP